MNIRDQFTFIVRPSPFIMNEYKTPQQYLDPAKIIQQRRNMKYNHHSQAKFKPSKRQKQFFIDQMIKPLKLNPSPCKYQTANNILDSKNAAKKINNVIKSKAIKNTYIDQIQRKQQKQKQPGIGKYNLLTITDFPSQSPIKFKSKQNPERRCYFDDKVTQSIPKPGPGEHNPHTISKKINIDRTNYKFYQQKHDKQEKKIKRSLSAKLGPTTYNPVFFNTFDSIKVKSKHREPSKWTHGTIQIRKGLRSAQKYPSPAQYQLINQWSPEKSMSARNKSSNHIGKLNLFEKTIKSARSLNIYRD